MATEQPLNLSRVDPPTWRVMVDDTVYGPFTLGQIRAFIDEGRVNPASKTAHGNGGAFIPARQQPRLRAAFAASTSATPAPTPAPTQPAPSNHVIIIRSAGDSFVRIIAALNEAGTFAEVMPGIVLVNSALRTARLRELVEGACDPADKVMIVNADSGRLAWIGLGPEQDRHIRSVWKARPTGNVT